MDNLYTYLGIAIGFVSVCAVFFFLGKRYSLFNIFNQKELRIIKKLIKKDILNQNSQNQEDSIYLKNFKMLDLWEVHIIGRESFRKMEVFIEQNGKFYEYEAIWNSEIFERNKQTGFIDNPIVKSVIRESTYISLSQWEETKSLGV